MYHNFLIHLSAEGHLGLLSCPGYYKQCCDEHWDTRVSFPSGFLSVYAQQWDCWIIRQILWLCYMAIRYSTQFFSAEHRVYPQCLQLPSLLPSLMMLTRYTAAMLALILCNGWCSFILIFHSTLPHNILYPCVSVFLSVFHLHIVHSHPQLQQKNVVCFSNKQQYWCH